MEFMKQMQSIEMNVGSMEIKERNCTKVWHKFSPCGK